MKRLKPHPMRRSFIGSIPSLSIFFIALLSTGAGQSGSTGSAHGAKESVGGIRNFGRVDTNLYRGGEPNRDGLEALKKMGVEIVVDLRGSANETENRNATKLGLQYISIPSHCPFPSDEPWARFLKVMEENRGKKVFVHCRLGDDRTGMAVAAYLMAEQGWSPEEALKEMREFGFNTWHRMICPGLEHYEEKFPERLRTAPAFQPLSLPSQRSAQ